jgi:Beta-ketoacyl synthase, N-terminal domain
MAASDDTNTVLITGVGLHGGPAAASGLEPAFEALARGESAVAPARLEGVEGLPPFAGAPAPRPPDVRPLLPDRKIAKYMSPTTKMAVVAAGAALADAELEGTDREAAALYVATGLIAFDLGAVRRAIQAARSDAGELDLRLLGERGLRLCHPLMPFKMLLNMPLGLISIIFGLRGPNAIYYPGADQGAVCMEAAWRGIRSGRLERALVGGTTNGLSLLPVATLRRAGRLAAVPAVAKPFSPTHAGYAPADAAAFLVLESACSARARGARPIAEITDVRSGRRGPFEPCSMVGSAQLVLLSGTLDRAADAAALAALPEQGRVTSLDAQLGHQGAATLFWSAALGAAMIERQRALPAQGCAAPDPRLVTEPSALELDRPLCCATVSPDGSAGMVTLQGVSS